MGDQQWPLFFSFVSASNTDKTPWGFLNHAVGMNGDRSRLGCCSVRPRAEHRGERAHPTVNGFACFEWPARARPTAPDPGCAGRRRAEAALWRAAKAEGFAEARAGALPNAIALFRLQAFQFAELRLLGNGGIPG